MAKTETNRRKLLLSCGDVPAVFVGGKIRNRQKSGKLANDLVFVRKAVFMDLVAAKD
jgi:hypothetical protein